MWKAKDFCCTAAAGGTHSQLSQKCICEGDIRFDDDPERRLSLAVDEPVDEVAAHLGGGVVEAEEAPVVLQTPGVAQLHRKRHALVLLLFWRELRKRRCDVWKWNRKIFTLERLGHDSASLPSKHINKIKFGECSSLFSIKLFLY